MSGTPRAGSYRAVLALPGAATTFAAALVGRSAYGLLPLSLLFTVRDATGSFATAGSALGLIGLTSIALPAKARLVDRYGPRRVLPPLALLAAAALALVATRPGAVACLLLAGAAGLALPPLGPSMRAVWAWLTDGGPLLPTAYSLDAVAEETLYVLGPVLVGVVLTVADAAAALLVTALVLALGTLVMVARMPAVHVAASSGARSRAVGLWRSPAFVAVVASVLVVAVALSLTATAVAASAVAAGSPAAAGWIDASLAVGSVVGGLVWGRRQHSRRWTVHVAGLACVLAVAPVAGAAGSGLVGLGVATGVTGLAVSPLFVVAYLATDRTAPEDRRTEASTWVNTGNNVGSAAGSALGGVLVQLTGLRPAYAVAAVVLLVLARAVIGSRRRIDPARLR